MFRCADEGELGDIGVAAVGPLVDVVDLGEVAGHVAARCGTAAVEGVQDQSLIAGRNAFGSAQIQRAFGVFIEDTQIVVGVGGHPDQVADGKQRTSARDGDSGRCLQLVERG